MPTDRITIPPNFHRHLRAFTLLELAIAVTVIGLLMGGVVAGTSIKRNAELNSIVREHNQFLVAIKAFKDQYFSIPGDMTNATKYWGIAGGATGNNITCRNIVSTDEKTCNGNGDLTINTPIGPLEAGPETTRFWQHLVNAKLIEGHYTGAWDGSDGATSPVNLPSGKFPNSLWSVFGWGTKTGGITFFDGVYDNTMWIGGYNGAGDANDPILNAQELWDIDTKIDDGKPATGVVFAHAILADFSKCTFNPAGGAVTSATLNAEYLTTASTPGCLLAFRQQF